MVYRKKNRKRECIDFATHPGLCLQFISGVVFGHLPRGQSFQYIRQGLGHIYNISRDPLLGANSVVSVSLGKMVQPEWEVVKVVLHLLYSLSALSLWIQRRCCSE